MRWSRPIPPATTVTSAPTSSHTLAISLMKEIFVARKAFDADLIISADVTSARTTGAASSLVEQCDPVALFAPERADDDSVGPHEVCDRGALGEELRVRDVTDLREPPGVQPRSYPFAGSGRNGALHYERSPLLLSGSSSTTCQTALRSASPE